MIPRRWYLQKGIKIFLQNYFLIAEKWLNKQNHTKHTCFAIFRSRNKKSPEHKYLIIFFFKFLNFRLSNLVVLMRIVVTRKPSFVFSTVCWLQKWKIYLFHTFFESRNKKSFCLKLLFLQFNIAVGTLRALRCVSDFVWFLIPMGVFCSECNYCLFNSLFRLISQSKDWIKDESLIALWTKSTNWYKGSNKFTA